MEHPTKQPIGSDWTSKKNKPASTVLTFMADLDRSPLPLSLASLRENYTRGRLDKSSVDPNPIVQFEQWFLEAKHSGLKEPNAMTLATATPDGCPSARIVLLKQLTADGFVFYTNYGSRKGRELAENPKAALVFLWAELERQVRIDGGVSRLSRAQSEEYFRSRPKGSRLGALLSRQSAEIPDRRQLEQELKDLETRYQATDDVPCPEFWGGYCVRPVAIEFWQGRPNRLHDRIRYVRQDNGSAAAAVEWRLERLSP
jgi:pyridoxamine 5'-phosphate oxidase